MPRYRELRRSHVAVASGEGVGVKSSTVCMVVLASATCAAFLMWARSPHDGGSAGIDWANEHAGWVCTAYHDSENKCVKPWGHVGYHESQATGAPIPSRWVWDDGTVERCMMASSDGGPCVAPTGHDDKLHTSEEQRKFIEGEN